MTNLVASRPSTDGPEPEAAPPSTALRVGVPVALVVLVVLGVATGNGVFTLGFVGFVVALLVSVTLHEGGHFLTARRFGMKATQFFVGFGPTLLSRQRGETEYGVKAVPAGGFVKIVGMTQLEELDAEDDRRAFWRYPAGQRAVVLSAGSVVHFVIALVLVLLSALAIGRAVELAPAVGEVAACVPATSDSDCDDAGALPSPAQAAGLQDGDVVVSIAGEPVDDSRELLEQVRASAGRPLDVVVERDGDQVPVTVTPVEVTRGGLPLLDADGNLVERDGEIAYGPDERVGAIGVAVQVRSGTERLGPVDAVQHSAEQVELIVTGIWTTLTEKLGTISDVYTDDRDPEGFIGVVGAGRISGEVLASQETLAFKVLAFLGLIAGLNFFVGVFNLLPLLPLDGGHIAVLAYEQARHKLKRLRGYAGELQRVDLTKLMPITYAVVVLFAGFTLWLLGADLVNPVRLS